MSLTGKVVGPKVDQFYEHSYSHDPVEYKPHNVYARKFFFFYNITIQYAYSDKADSWQKIHRQTGASEHTVNFNKPTWLCGDEKLNKLNNSKHIYSRETTNPPYLHGDEETASFNGGK